MGVHALIWVRYFFNHQPCYISSVRFADIPPSRQIDSFDDKWMTRRDSLISTLQNNPKAKFVTRAVQFGFVPLTDRVVSANELTSLVQSVQNDLSSFGIPVTVSEMVSGYQSVSGAQSVLDAVDFVDLIMLPYEENPTATTANNSWSFIEDNVNWIASNANGKKIILSVNGWPSAAVPIIDISPSASATVQEMQDYFTMLDSNCQAFKDTAGGGIGWFAHAYSVEQVLDYGILKGGQPQFPFSPQTSC